MQLGRGRRVRAIALVRQFLPLIVALAAAGCNTVAQQTGPAGTPRGATVAFDSIDGPPREVFDRLVRDLNTEAQGRQLAVMSRDDNAAYRVRGYLGAVGSKSRSSISWVWDIYDSDRQRVLRITGEEVIAGKHADAWKALDDAALERIARNSMDQLSAFLTSTAALPSAPTEAAFVAGSSPEASGIFRIQQINADPTSTIGKPAPADDAVPAATDDEPGIVPTPPQRPRATLTTASLAATPSGAR